MLRISSLVLVLMLFKNAEAKIWRVNNNAGVIADFNSFAAAMASASVVNGDTIHIEPSATQYPGATVSKRLVIIGAGYLLDPANTSFPGNAGLQASVLVSNTGTISLVAGSEGSKIMGITFASITVGNLVAPTNLVIERCFATGPIAFSNGSYSNVTIRKCFFSDRWIEQTSGSMTGFVCENNIFHSSFAYINLGTLTGTGNIFRNNSLNGVGVNSTLANCYVANNIFGSVAINLTNCVVKNNFFSTNQTLPGTAVGNQVNVVMSNVYQLTGSFDGQYALKAGSPALNAGVTVGGITPNIGAYSGGGIDSYVPSGIPNIPTIYQLTVPTSIPTGTATMNVTISTRNNN
ncbi:MAG TPA: hypothetical protein VFR58_06925 [Flavisolibacter sp.]|nr:hypothetical protein [Flavisolibacter sp.]